MAAKQSGLNLRMLFKHYNYKKNRYSHLLQAYQTLPKHKYKFGNSNFQACKTFLPWSWRIFRLGIPILIEIERSQSSIQSQSSANILCCSDKSLRNCWQMPYTIVSVGRPTGDVWVHHIYWNDSLTGNRSNGHFVKSLNEKPHSLKSIEWFMSTGSVLAFWMVGRHWKWKNTVIQYIDHTRVIHMRIRLP